MFACKRHWFTLPKPLRNGILETYRPKQEFDKRPSPEYLTAAHAAIHWLHQHEGIETATLCLVCAEAA